MNFLSSPSKEKMTHTEMPRKLPGAVRSKANSWKMGSLFEVYLLIFFLLTQIENKEIRREKNECRYQQWWAVCAVLGKSQRAEGAVGPGSEVRLGPNCLDAE